MKRASHPDRSAVQLPRPLLTRVVIDVIGRFVSPLRVQNTDSYTAESPQFCLPGVEGMMRTECFTECHSLLFIHDACGMVNNARLVQRLLHCSRLVQVNSEV